MPAVTKSRRRRPQRAAPSSDIEEEDVPSQQRADEVDNDEDSGEDAQPVRKKVTVKKEKKPKVERGKAPASVAGPSKSRNNDDEDEDDGRIDIENFHDQPLDRKEGAKLHGIAQDWELIRKQIHQSSFRLVKDVAISLADVMEVGDTGGALDDVDGIMKKLLDIDQEMRSHETTLNKLHQAVMRGEVVENVLGKYENEVKQRMDKYNKGTTRQKYASTEEYVKFKQGIYEVQNPGHAIPPIGELVPREEGDPSDDEEELEVGGVTQDFKCPISLTFLKDPMTSEVCGHSYSRLSIQDYLTNAGRDAKCPASGCNKRITMSSLRVDKELEKRIKIAARKQQRQEEEGEEDDGEVIE